MHFRLLAMVRRGLLRTARDGQIHLKIQMCSLSSRLIKGHHLRQLICQLIGCLMERRGSCGASAGEGAEKGTRTRSGDQKGRGLTNRVAYPALPLPHAVRPGRQSLPEAHTQGPCRRRRHTPPAARSVVGAPQPSRLGSTSAPSPGVAGAQFAHQRAPEALVGQGGPLLNPGSRSGTDGDAPTLTRLGPWSPSRMR